MSKNPNRIVLVPCPETGKLLIYVSEELIEQLKGTVLASELITFQEAIKGVAQTFADEMKKLSDEVVQRVGKIFKGLRVYCPSESTLTNKQQSIAYRLAQQHHAQQQLQQVRGAQGANNRYWQKHRRRY